MTQPSWGAPKAFAWCTDMCETLSVCVCASECACPARHMPHMPHMHANKAVQQQPQRKLKPNQTKPNQVAFPLRVFIHKIEEHKKMAQRLLPPAYFVLPPPLSLPLPLSLLLYSYNTTPRPPLFVLPITQKARAFTALVC